MTRSSSPYGSSRWWSSTDTASAAEARHQAEQERAQALLDVRHAALTLGEHADLAELSAAEVEALPLESFARLRSRVGLPAFELSAPAATTDDPGDQVSPDAVIASQYADSSPDFGSMSLDEYAQVRARFIRPQGNRGLFS